MAFVTCNQRQHAWICEQVVTSAAGIEPGHATRVFIRVMEDFLNRSGAWIDEKWFNIGADRQFKVDFSDKNGQMAWIMWVQTINGRPVHHRTVDPGHFRSANNEFSRLPLSYSNTPYPDVFTVWPLPTNEDDRRVLVRAALTFNQCDIANGKDEYIPDWLFDRYKEGIRLGTMAALHVENGKPYTNLKLAKDREAEYLIYMDRSRDEARRGFGMNEAEWIYPQVFIA